MYQPKYFKSYELLPPDIYQKHGDNGLYFMDDRILWTLDRLRETLKQSIVVNTWKQGGKFSQRGYRNDPAVGAPYSLHRFGRAVDFDFVGMTAAHFREMAKEGSFPGELQHITRIEENVNWIHMDCAGLPRVAGQEIDFFKP
jgi:uncharacterized protein YcbK (DUF882 family)